jgi:hypothetical protein
LRFDNSPSILWSCILSFYALHSPESPHAEGILLDKYIKKNELFFYKEVIKVKWQKRQLRRKLKNLLEKRRKRSNFLGKL